MKVCYLVLAIFVSLFTSAQNLPAEHYAYDQDGRLIQVDYGNGKRIDYAYDLIGNLTNLEIQASQPEVDNDADGLADAWELVYFDNLAESGDGDPNGNGRSNLEDFQAASDPATDDNDHDKVSNENELAAGTDPFDPNSYLGMGLRLEHGITLTWSSVVGHNYQVYRTTGSNQTYAAISPVLSATPNTNLWTDPSPPVDTALYHIEVKKD